MIAWLVWSLWQILAAAEWVARAVACVWWVRRAWKRDAG